MTKIKEEVLVKCPPDRAREYLLSHFKSKAGSQPGPATLRLTATLGPKHGAHATIERSATADFMPQGSEGDLEYRVLIDWTPDSREPLPKFDGLFRIQWDEEFGSCRLVIEGSYEPPLGAIGRAFDAAVGRRIAQDTMRSLLGELRTVIENQYAKDVG